MSVIREGLRPAIKIHELQHEHLIARGGSLHDNLFSRSAETYFNFFFTLEDAVLLSGDIVYGLNDHNGMFYVGKTRCPSRRFSDYRDGKGSTNTFVARRLRSNLIRVSVLELNPSNLEVAELFYIQKFGSDLLNIEQNPFSELKKWWRIRRQDPFSVGCRVDYSQLKSFSEDPNVLMNSYIGNIEPPENEYALPSGDAANSRPTIQSENPTSYT